MWTKGRIETQCSVVNISPSNSETSSDPGLVKRSNDASPVFSLIHKGNGAFLVNSSWECTGVSDEVGLIALSALLQKNYNACRLTLANIKNSLNEKRAELFVEFEISPWSSLRKFLRDVASYCVLPTSSLPERPMDRYPPMPMIVGGTEYIGAPSYEIADVFLQSNRRTKLFSSAVVVSGDFKDFPVDIAVKKVLPFLSAKDMRMLRITCKYFWEVGEHQVPGLIPRLFKHQEASLALMEQQERSPSDLKDLYYQRLVDTRTGLEFAVDVVTGVVYSSFAEAPSVIARKGGLLCDAPGLGKTVAVLSLILRTRGMCALNGQATQTASSATELVSSISPVDTSITPTKDSHGNSASPSSVLSWMPTPSPQSVMKRSTPARLERSRKEEQRSKAPGVKTTLVVVPKPLMTHWKKQIELHVKEDQLSYLAVDGGNLPALSTLANLDILLVTIHRMSLEEKREDSVLRQVCFLRCIVDEGHALGASGQAALRTNYATLLKSICAERFWIMTGTPAKLTNTMDGLQSLGAILGFLNAYGGANTWKESIVRGFKDRNHPVCFYRLVAILRRTLIRHVKDDIIQDLSELVRSKTMLELSHDEKVPYNTLVSFVRSNVMLTSIGTTGGWDQSLLNPIHRKQCQELIHNLRLACCTGAVEQLRLNLSERNYADTLKLFGKEPPQVQLTVRQFLDRCAVGESTQCGQCKTELPLMLVTRCGHFFCVDCMDTTQCRSCLAVIDGDDLAMIQPGFSLSRWVRADLVGLGAGASTKGNHIVARIIQERQGYLSEKGNLIRPKFIVFSQFRSVLNVVGDQLIRAFGADAVAEFWGKYRDVELTKFVRGTVEEWHCPSCNRKNPDAMATSCHLPVVVVRIPSIGQQRRLCRPETEVVGWNSEALPVVGSPLLLSEGNENAIVIQAGPCRGRRSSAVPVLRTVDCDILLLSKDGSHGLDISCATHVFLLEYLWDAALEDQIVSRAWRLGNKAKRVKVEQLIMQSTVEEILMDMSSNDHQDASSSLFGAESDATMSSTATGTATETSRQSADQGTKTVASDPRIKILLERTRLV